MMMDANWRQIVEYIKSQKHWLHFLYSRDEGWGHISYKQDRIKIDSSKMSLADVQQIVNDLKAKYRI